MANSNVLGAERNVITKLPSKLKPRELKVLAVALIADPNPVYGYELIEKTNISAGNLYPVLIDLEDKGLLESEMIPSTSGPRRRIYRLRREHVQWIKEALNEQSGELFGTGRSRQTTSRGTLAKV